jgi:hypothetical protein
MNLTALQIQDEIKNQLKNNFSEAVDDSPYGIDAWTETLIEFQSWAKSQNRHIPFKSQVDYLCCCIQGANAAASLIPLKKLWQDYVDQYGVL